MSKTLGYTGSSGWSGWIYRGNGGENMVLAVNNPNNLLRMPETGYITSVSVFAAGIGGRIDSEIFVADTTTQSYIVDMYCALAQGSETIGGQSWNTVSPGSPPLAYSGRAYNIGFWRSTNENAVWSYYSANGPQFDYGYVASAPSQGGTLGSHTVQGNAWMGAYFTYTPAAPIINSLSSWNGAPNTQFTISGAALQAVSSVTINGAGCSFTIQSDGQITVTVPFGATSGLLSVTNPYGTTSPGNFTVNGAPIVSGMSPTSGTIGSTFTVNGSYFSNLTQVTINGTSCPFSINSDSAVTVTVASGATQGAVNLTNAYGTTNAGTFTPLAAPKPTSISPTSGAFGATFTVAGHYFTGVSSVQLNGVNCPTFTVNSDTQVTVTVPSGSTAGAVLLTNSYGQGSVGTFTPLAAPTASSLSPTTGGTGSSAIVTGHYLTGTTSVTVNGVSASFTVNSDTQITFTIPSSATTGSVLITNPRGSVNAGTFTVNNSPAITSYSPAAGYVGTVISLAGSHFTGVTSATISGYTASFSVSSDAAMTVTIPQDAVTGPLVVTNASGATTVGVITIYDPQVFNNTQMQGSLLQVWNNANSTWNAPTAIQTWNGSAWTN